MYDTFDDPNCYKGTNILKNYEGIQDFDHLQSFELAMVSYRLEQDLPQGNFDINHILKVHHHLFQDVYPFAGKIRKVRIAKNGNSFCYPEYIETELAKIVSQLSLIKENIPNNIDELAKQLASVLSNLNAIHPFREGNGRTQTVFISMFSDFIGYPWDFERLEAETYLNAMVSSFAGDESLLRLQIKGLISP